MAVNWQGQDTEEVTSAEATAPALQDDTPVAGIPGQDAHEQPGQRDVPGVSGSEGALPVVPGGRAAADAFRAKERARRPRARRGPLGTIDALSLEPPQSEPAPC